MLCCANAIENVPTIARAIKNINFFIFLYHY
jgi:hypothetical protein